MPPGSEAGESPIPGEPEHISLPETGQQPAEMQAAQAASLPPLPLAGLPQNPPELHTPQVELSAPEKPAAAHPSLPQVQREAAQTSRVSPAAAPPEPGTQKPEPGIKPLVPGLTLPEPGAQLPEPQAQPSGLAEEQPASPRIEPATQEHPEKGQENQPLPLAPVIPTGAESPAAFAAGMAGVVQETPAAPQARPSLPTPPSGAVTPEEGIALSIPAAETEVPPMQPAAELPLATILPAQPEIQRKVESAGEAPAGIERHEEPGPQVKTAGGEMKEAVCAGS